MPMKNPVHPGQIVRHGCLEALGLSVTAGAKVLGVSRQALSNLVTGKAGVSPDMAIRLSKAFGSTPETWLKMQLAYDLADAMKHERRIKVSRYHRAESVAWGKRRRRKHHATHTLFPTGLIPPYLPKSSSQTCDKED